MQTKKKLFISRAGEDRALSEAWRHMISEVFEGYLNIIDYQVPGNGPTNGSLYFNWLLDRLSEEDIITLALITPAGLKSKWVDYEISTSHNVARMRGIPYELRVKLIRYVRAEEVPEPLNAFQSFSGDTFADVTAVIHEFIQQLVPERGQSDCFKRVPNAVQAYIKAVHNCVPAAKTDARPASTDERVEVSARDVLDWLQTPDIRARRKEPLFDDQARRAIEAVESWRKQDRLCRVFILNGTPRYWGLCPLRLDDQKLTGVWLAWDAHHPDVPLVVVKELKNDGGGLQQITDEVLAYERLRGIAGVPRLLAAGRTWFAVEFAEYGSLRRYFQVKDVSPMFVPEAAEHAYRDPVGMSWEIVRSCFVQLAQLIAELHDRDWVHCDIHLANIVLVQGDGDVRLIDFQVARPGERLSANFTQGHHSYCAAPEGHGTKASDVYSVARCLKHCLDMAHVIASPPRSFPATPRPRELQQLIERATVNDPAARISARQFAQDLAGIDWRPQASQPTLIAASVIAAVCVIAILWSFVSKSPPECASLPNAVFVGGSSASRNFLSRLAMRRLNEMMIVYQESDSCSGIQTVNSFVPLTGQADYWTVSGLKKCVFRQDNGHLDVAVSDVSAQLCNVPLKSDIKDVLGPVQAMSFVVPEDSGVKEISAEDAKAVYTGHPTGPWQNQDLVLRREKGSGSQHIVAAALAMDSKDLSGGVVQTSTAGVLSRLRELGVLDAGGSAALAFLSSTTVIDRRDEIDELAFQRSSAEAAYLPDSAANRSDKRNVRKGRYPMWAPLHIMVRRGGTDLRRANDRHFVGNLVDYMTGNKEIPGVGLVKFFVESGVVPECAMEVQRRGDDLASDPVRLIPVKPCGCSFEHQAGAPTQDANDAADGVCTPCKKDADCPAGNSLVCSYGFCERGPATLTRAL